MIGRILGGRYEVREKIGSGGMADVYKAYCTKLNRFVAIKILKDQYNVDREFVSRFELESQAAASLSHNNIVSVYDVGFDGVHYIVMELLNGITLKEYISVHGMLPWSQALDFSIQICDAMEHAHKKGIVHRDIKPQNIMVTDNNILKVMDFGIARTANKDVSTEGNSALGSVHYISPEQAKGSYVDTSSDIYSMGVVMYEMLTGRVPFDGDSHVQIALMHMRENPVPPCDVNISIPYELQEVCLKALAKEPSERFTDAGEMLQALNEIAAGQVAPEKNKTIEDYEEYVTSVLAPESGEVPTYRYREEERQMPKQQKPHDRKNDRKAKILVICGSVLIVLIFVFVFIHAINPNLFGGSENVQLMIDKYPNLVGRKIEDVKKEYKNNEHVTIKEAKERVESVEYEEEGYIVSQTPKAGKKVTDEDITITVTVSKGNKEGLTKVPDFTDKHYENAVKTLDKYGIDYEIIPDENKDMPEGYVISQTPRAGKKLNKNTKVKLYVNMSERDEEELEKVPNVVGLDIEDAKTEVEGKGFTIGSVTEEESDKPKGTVLSQSPDSGSELKIGYRVNVTISNGVKKSGAEKVGSTNDAPALSTAYLTVDLPQDKELVDVVIKIDGKDVFEQQYATNKGTADVRITGSGTKNVEVYFDGELDHSENISFNE